MDNNYIIEDCPNCGEPVQLFLNELNCKIFRHGVYKKSGQQIDPHLDEKSCNSLKNKNKIYGCGKPFRVNDFLKLEKCDYI